MSMSRKNWKALSSKARQWTMEDEEEVERERRRRVKSSTSTADPEGDSSPPHEDAPASDSAFEENSGETSQSSSSVDPTQSLDFMEMLRGRDEKRRTRHVEMLRRQKEVAEDGGESGEGRGVKDREDVNGYSDKEQGRVSASTHTSAGLSKTTLRLSSSKTSSITNGQQEKSEPSRSKDPTPEPTPEPTSKTGHKFVSSFSFSMDTSRSPSGSSTPTSLRGASPCTSPRPDTPQSPVHNGHSRQEVISKASFSFSPTSSSTNSDLQRSTTPAFVRQSSRTVSFRMMKKKEEETSPLQRSASVRMTSKKFEPVVDKSEEEDKLSSFQRSSRQRVSSRSIQEKMERLAQAAQRSDSTRGAEASARHLYLVDEVSKKRGIFEKEPPASAAASRQEIRTVKTGVSDRISRWLNKTSPPGPQTPSDVRHVDISSKRSMFETSDSLKTSPGKM